MPDSPTLLSFLAVVFFPEWQALSTTKGHGVEPARTLLPSIALRMDQRARSGAQIVAMMKTAESWYRYDPSTGARIPFSTTTGRRSLRQREMRPVFVIAANVLTHQAFQMPLIQDNYMVKQIAAAVADPALGHAVLPRTAEAGSLQMNAETLHGVDHFLNEIGTAIKD